jgi:PAS domain S-box-containing protein
MNEFTLTVLSISIILQLTAAIFALRLNRKSSRVGHAWLLIAAALTLMATRRIVTFVGFFAPQVEATVKGPVAESIALLIAILMLAGVLLIPRIFNSLQQVTEALRASEARYRALVDSAEDIIFSLDRNGFFLTINASTLRRLNWTEADFVGKTIHNFYPPQEAAFYEKQYAQVFETGQPIRFERHSLNELGDFWLSTSLSPIFDATGKVVSISGISRDITEQMRVEEQIRLQSAALEAAANGIVITNRKGAVIWVNPAFSHMTGYISEEIFGRTMRILKSGQQDQSFYKKLWGTILSGQVWHNEITNRRKDGSFYIEEQTITPVRATGSEITHFIAIQQDITARKQLEQQAAEQIKRLKKLSELSMTLAGDPVEVFNHVAHVIGELLAVDVVCLSEIRDDELHFLSVYADGEVMTNVGHAPLNVTPCATVTENKDIQVYDHVAERFPKAEFLQTYNAFSYCGFPALDSAGNVVSVTCLLDEKPHHFSEEDKDLLRIFAQRIGLEIERHTHLAERRRAEESLRTRARQQAIIAELGQLALATTDLSLLMNETVTSMKQTLAVEYVKVLELLPGGDVSLLRAGAGWQEGLVGKAMVGVGTDSQAGYTLLSSTPVIVEDLRSETRFSGPPLLHDHDVVSGVSVIIAGQEQPFGILSAHTTQQRPFTDDDVHFLQAAANVLAEAIESTRLFEAERAARRQAETLQAATQALSRTLDLPQVFDLILSELQQVVPYDSASVQQLKGDQLEIIGGHGFPNLEELLGVSFDLTAGDNPNREVIRTRDIFIVDDAPAIYSDFSVTPHAQAGIRSWLGVPLLFGNQLIGMLALDKQEVGFYTKGHAHLALGFAAQAAIAIENARLFATATRRASELAVLMRLGQAISANLDLDTILETTYRGVGELMDNDAFWISTYKPGTEYSQYLIKIDRGVHHPLDEFSINAGIGGYAIRTGKPILMDRPALQGKFTQARYGSSDPVEIVLCVPLQIGNQIIGAISTQSYTPNAYSEKELTLLTRLTQPIAIAMENARLFTAEHAARRQAETLQAATQAMSGTLNLSQVFELILSELRQVVPYDSASVQQLKGDQLEIIGGHGFPNLENLLGARFDLTVGDNPNQEVIRTRDPVIVDDAPDIYSNFSVDPHAQAGIHSWLGVPLLFGDHLIGMLALDNQEVSFYTEEHAHLALGFAAQAAIAIENAELVNQLRAHATTLEQRVAERTYKLAEANEQLKELDQLKSKFVSDVSHELRTPVTNLSMYLDLLERGKPERHAQYINILKEQTGRLKQLIESILDLSRLELAKDTKVAFGAVDLNEVVAQVVTIHLPQAKAASLRFTFEPDAGLSPIQGERNQLIQVVTNLVINALNYTAAGNIQVSTYLDFDQVCLQVKDTGIGIEPEDLPHLFERFYRGQHASQSTIPGSGLGLGIVKEIVDLHKGKIEVQSEVGAGTIFRVRLPVAN